MGGANARVASVPKTPSAATTCGMMFVPHSVRKIAEDVEPLAVKKAMKPVAMDAQPQIHQDVTDVNVKHACVLLMRTAVRPPGTKHASKNALKTAMDAEVLSVIAVTTQMDAQQPILRDVTDVNASNVFVPSMIIVAPTHGTTSA